jgi:glycosyltransferase involved in cell wall biosynthesis
MRVLEVIYSYRIGGSEIVGIEIAEQLSDAGAKVLCASISGDEGPLLQRCMDSSIEPVTLGISESSPLGRNGLNLALVSKLRSLRLDAIHLHHMLAHNKLALPARMAGVPRIVTTEHSIATLQESRLARLRAQLSWRLAHHFTAVDTGIRDYLVQEIGVTASRVDVVRNGIRLQRWHRDDRDQRRRELGLGDDFTFVFVGRIEKVKNVPGLIRAFLKMQATSSLKCRLLVVGDGSQLDACKAQLQDQSLADRVTLIGEAVDARVYTAAADAFIMNSLSEGSPRAMIEAMAMGLPSVCPAVGGVKNLLSEGRGWLTEPQGEADLCRAMQEMAADRANATVVGERARDFVYREFNAKTTSQEYQRLFGG